MNDSAPELNARAGDLEALLDEVDAVLFRLTRLLSAHVEADEEGFSMTPPQYMALKVLEREAPLRVSDVAEHMGVGSSAASMLLQSLAEEDLIERADDPEDRRAKLVSVSAEGRARLARSEEERHIFMQRITSTLTPREMRALIRALRKIADATTARD